MPVFYSPSGNPEIWEVKPKDYYTPEEWELIRPPDPEPVPEPKYTDAQIRDFNIGLIDACGGLEDD